MGARSWSERLAPPAAVAPPVGVAATGVPPAWRRHARSRDAGGVEGGEEHAAVAVDGGDLVGRRHEVDGCRGVGQPHRQLVVAGGPSTLVAGVGLDEQIEQRARPVEPGPLPLEHPALAQAIGGDDHRWLEPRADVVDPGAQLVAGQAGRRCRTRRRRARRRRSSRRHGDRSPARACSSAATPSTKASTYLARTPATPGIVGDPSPRNRWVSW